MTTIELALLSAVSGGADSTSKTTASVKAFGSEASVTRETRLTENESCRRDVKAACNSTNSGFWGVDQAKAGQCFLEAFPKCPK
jgi:NH3-dependent NAD+ synthetase